MAITLRSAPRYLRILTGIAFLALTPSSLAQGCSLCYTQAASATGRFIAALREGILILIFPALAVGILIAVLAYRKRNQFASSQAAESDSAW